MDLSTGFGSPWITISSLLKHIPGACNERQNCIIGIDILPMELAHPTNVDEWSWEDIATLEDQTESRYLEFKSRLHASGDEEDGEDAAEEESLWRKKLEREIAAFANASGGMIVFGVDDDGRTDLIQRPDHEIDQSITAIIQNTNPLPEVKISDPLEPPTEETDRIALVVEVEETTRKPVMTSDSAIYMRINDRKEPMSREQIESLFIEYHRKQEAIRQLEMEIDRFSEAIHGKRGLRVHDEAPPDYHLLNIESLKQVLRNNSHLYADEEIREQLRPVFEELVWIEDREVYVGRVISNIQRSHHDSQETFYRSERRKLKRHAEGLERKLGRLADSLDLQVAVSG